MTSNSCIDGYYYLNRQCILCPAEFSKCHYDQESKSVKSLQCIGENRLYIPEMNCPCIEGFYPIKFVSSCFACNPVCTTCTSFKNCTECLPGYYLQLHKDQINRTCKKCSPLCKTCSQQDTCDTCESRQFDPSTGCTQQYVSGNSNYSSQDGSESQNGGGYTNNGGEYQNGQYINGSGSGSGTTSGSGGYYNGSGSGSGTTSGSGGYYNGSGSGSGTTSGSGEYQNGSGSGSGTNQGSGDYQNGSGSGSGNYGSGDYQNGSESGSGNYGSGDYQNGSGSGSYQNGTGNNYGSSGNYQGTGSTNQYGGNGQYNNNGTGSGSEGTNDIQNAVYQENFKSQFQQESTASFSMFNPTTNMTYQVSCNPECNSCEDQAEKCLTCHIGLNRQNDPPFCGCLQGYYNQVDSYDCLQCNSTCLECRTKNECTSCNDMDFRKLDESRQCSCISGYKEVKGQSQCQVCYQIQEECVFKCPAYTIQDEQQKVCQHITYLTYPRLLKYVICGIFVILVLVIAKVILNKLTFKQSFVWYIGKQQQYEEFKYLTKLKVKQDSSQKSSSDSDENNEKQIEENKV